MTRPPASLDGPERAPASGRVRRLLVFLHGVGADGHDLIGLAPMLNLPDTQFVSPHAPFAFDMAPQGHQWFSLSDRDLARMQAGINTAAPLLDAYLDALLARFSLPPSALALLGFSQGAMMAMHAAPRRAQPLAGVVAIAGALLVPPPPTPARAPLCLIHGEEDEVVPFAAMGMAQAALSAAGLPVQAHGRPGLGHGIDEKSVAIAAEFLQHVLPPAA